MLNSKILSNITSNTDNFSWRELNCMYKPVAIILKSFDKELFDFFLAYYSFINIYGLDDTFYNFNVGKAVHPLFVYLKKNLEKIFNIVIENCSYDNEEDFCNSLIKCINEDKVPLIPGNLRGLYYNTMYKIKDHIHCFVIKGYDKKRKIYYILDNMHIDDGASTIYKNFSIRFKDLYNLYKLADKPDCMFFSQKEKTDKTKIISNILLKLESVANSKETVTLVEQIFYKDLKNNIHFSELDEKLVIANERRVFIDSSLKIFESYGVSKFIIEDISNQYYNCIKNWTLLRTKEIMLNKHTGELHQIENNISNFLDADINVIKYIANCYKDINFCHDTSSHNDYEIINNNGAIIDCEGDSFKITLDSAKVYDEWINTSNAPKILWEINSGESFVFKVQLSINAKTGSSFLGGIVIETNNEKFYFGNIKNTQTVIFVPLRNEDYSIYEENIAITNFMVKSFCDEKIDFYISLNDKYKCIYTEKNTNKIKKIGIFSKSWECTDSQISYKIELEKKGTV